MTNSYPDKDEDLGVSDAVLALRHPDHWELGRTLTLRHQVAYLDTKSIWSNLWQKMPLIDWTLALRHQVPHLGTKRFWSNLWQKMPQQEHDKWETELIEHWHSDTSSRTWDTKSIWSNLWQKMPKQEHDKWETELIEHWHSYTMSRTWRKKFLVKLVAN
jgi:hypothetical protein